MWISGHPSSSIVSPLTALCTADTHPTPPSIPPILTLLPHSHPRAVNLKGRRDNLSEGEGRNMVDPMAQPQLIDGDHASVEDAVELRVVVAGTTVLALLGILIVRQGKAWAKRRGSSLAPL